MKQKMVLTILVLGILISGLNGCCNRCNQPSYSAIPTAAAGQGQSYAASAPSYMGRRATK